MKSYKTIDEYISSFPTQTQALLKQMRATIKKAAPKSVEGISYGMPACNDLNGKHIVFFGGYKKHIGFYPTPSGTNYFRKDLLMYKTSKGAIQFPLDKKLPLTLIAKIVKFRVAEEKAKQTGVHKNNKK